MDLTNLKAFWSLNESSDGSGAVTREDLHGTNDLTDNNTVASGTGLVYSNAADLEVSSGEFLRVTDNEDLTIGDNDCTIVAWVNVNHWRRKWW